MDDFNKNMYRATVNPISDGGLSAYMRKVFLYMSMGLLITALVAFFVASSPVMLQLIYTPPLSWIVQFSPLVFILVLSFGVNKLSASTAQILFWIFSAVMGASLSGILIYYTGSSVARVFFITSATFLTMSVWGYTTNADLSKFGSILFMMLIGMIIASVVNIFMSSSALDFGISIIGVIVFTGLTAWDVQKLKIIYSSGSMDSETYKKTAVYGALSLYLDFINLFLMLLRLMGQARD